MVGFLIDGFLDIFVTTVPAFDTIDACIEKYNGLIPSNSYEDTLLFYKVHESVLPLLAPLAKKFLVFQHQVQVLRKCLILLDTYIVTNDDEQALNYKLNESYL